MCVSVDARCMDVFVEVRGIIPQVLPTLSLCVCETGSQAGLEIPKARLAGQQTPVLGYHHAHVDT